MFRTMTLTVADAATLIGLDENPWPPRSFSIYESCDVLVNAGLATPAGPGRWHLTAKGRAALASARAFAYAEPWSPWATWDPRLHHFAHSEDPRKMRGWRAAAVQRLAGRGLIRRVRGRYGDRWVVTTTGSYALGTFDSSRMHDRRREVRHQAAERALR